MLIRPSDYGPTLPISAEQHAKKYRAPGETFYDYACRFSAALADNEEHRRALKSAVVDMAYLPAGRSQRAVGSPHKITAINCFVSGEIADDSMGIFDKVKEAFLTMRVGGGIGYDFSTIRPDGARVVSLGSTASGPVSFMHVFDAACRTVMSAGSRRGAQMAVLRCDHPDIEKFVTSKQDIDPSTGQSRDLRHFNISVACTDEFMAAVKRGDTFSLSFEGRVFATVDARLLWDKIMRSTWDYAEPGVLFIDTINRMNNLWYCEEIESTNPCGEQPLPPYGSCLLGSVNMVKFVRRRAGKNFIDIEAMGNMIPAIVRATDNIIDQTMYPLEEQRLCHQSNRRMGLGVTGMANAIEACGLPYGSEGYIALQSKILQTLRDTAYTASALLAKEKGVFPLFDKEKHLDGNFTKTLPGEVRDLISEYGIRNSHLTSIAPTGTISLTADNVSSGIEPVFSHKYDRRILDGDRATIEEVTDYGYREFGVMGVTADELSPEEHVDVLVSAQHFVDSACSKTCNVGSDVSWDRFKNLYMRAYDGGAKGCTTFRAAGKIYGILTKKDDDKEGGACYIDPTTGQKECS